jgi:hypothetical protein
MPFGHFSRPLASLCLAVTFAAPLAAAPVEMPGAPPLPTVDFERHVMGVFSKAGCNNGSCHGSFQGKNGFRLSLFGFEPEKDHAAVTRDNLGRRIDPVNPDQSLLLTKSVGSVPHEGAARFGRDSWQYKLLRSWIADGAVRTPGRGTVEELTVTPPELAFRNSDATQNVRVTARFADGSSEIVTPLCDFRTQDDAVAVVTTTGTVTPKKPGDTALVVSYRGKVQAVRVLVPSPVPPGFVYPKVPVNNDIDRLVFEKLRRLNMVPSDLSGDLEFLRRVTIDTIGCLPTPEEARAFLADKRPDKRDRKIDELLNHPLHAAVWATKYSDITGNNTDALEQPPQLQAKRSQMWHDWLTKRFAENMPYDQIVKGMLCATSRDSKTPEEWLAETKKIEGEAEKGWTTSYAERDSLDLYWRRRQNVQIEQWGEKAAAAFLGVRLECAQCHKHPTDRWTQVDYRAFANVFSQVAFASSPEAAKLINEENKARRDAVTDPKLKNRVIPVREVYVTTPKPGAGERNRKGKENRPRPGNLLKHPDTNEPLTPKAPGGPEIDVTGTTDARLKLFEWMRDPANPFFARSFVNRVWDHYFGVGLVEPVDDFSIANPPSNPKLLDALAQEFVKSGYDIRAIERLVLKSRTYQLSAKVNSTNRFDRNNYSHAYIRPMMAEAVVDVLNSALGVTEQFGAEAPAGRHMTQVGASRLNNPNLMYALRVFGRPPRTTACDCERVMDPALPQTLYRMTDPAIQTKLGDQRNRVARLVKDKADNDRALDDLFLATLTRFPTESEKASFKQHMAKSGDRTEALTDTLWALINTREFILNH